MPHPLFGYVNSCWAHFFESARQHSPVLCPGVATLAPIKGLSPVIISFLCLIFINKVGWAGHRKRRCGKSSGAKAAVAATVTVAVTIRGWLKSPREQLGRNEGSRGGGDHEGQREGKRGQKTKAENTKEPEKRNCSPRHWKSSRSCQGLRIPTP